MTVEEMLRRMSSRELTEHVAYHKILCDERKSEALQQKAIQGLNRGTRKPRR